MRLQAYVDGGVTIQRFLAAGYIDRLVITRVPVLIRAGIPLFGPVPRDIRLRYVATHSYTGGLVQSEYEVGEQGPSQALRRRCPRGWPNGCRNKQNLVATNCRLSGSINIFVLTPQVVALKADIGSLTANISLRFYSIGVVKSY
jgi:hypothetical protein